MKQNYNYLLVDKVLIVALIFWALFTLVGHTLIHALGENHTETNMHLHGDGIEHIH